MSLEQTRRKRDEARTLKTEGLDPEKAKRREKAKRLNRAKNTFIGENCHEYYHCQSIINERGIVRFSVRIFRRYLQKPA